MRIVIDGEELYESLDAASGYRDEILFNLLDKGLLGRVHEYSDTAIYANLIPKDAMEVYEPGEIKKLGVDLEMFKRFIKGCKTDVEITHNKGRINVSYDNKSYYMGLIDPKSVKGVPDINPQLDLPVKVEGDHGWLTDFADETYSKIFGREDSAIFIRYENGVIYLWGKRDDSEMSEHFHIEDFEDYDINWEYATDNRDITHGDIEYHPKEAEIANNIIATQFLRPINVDGGKARVEFGDYQPLKVVVEKESGVKHSWIIPPRIPSKDKHARVPERLINNRTVL